MQIPVSGDDIGWDFSLLHTLWAHGGVNCSGPRGSRGTLSWPSHQLEYLGHMLHIGSCFLQRSCLHKDFFQGCLSSVPHGLSREKQKGRRAEGQKGVPRRILPSRTTTVYLSLPLPGKDLLSLTSSCSRKTEDACTTICTRLWLLSS